MRRKVNHNLSFLMSVSEISNQELISIIARQPAQKLKDFSPLTGSVPVAAEMKTQMWEGK